MSLFDKDNSHFTFTYHHGGKNVSVNLNKEDPTVPEVLEEVLNFLKACGYCFDVDDRLDVVNDFRHPSLNSERLNDEEVSSDEDAWDGLTWVDSETGKEFRSMPDFNITYKTKGY